MNRSTPTFVEIDLHALRQNFRALKKRVQGASKVMVVVKSNAYGHGLVPVARTLQIEGADFFGVGTVDEGILLREAGIKRPILILLGLIEDKFPELLRYDLIPTLYDLKTAAELQRFLEGRGQTLNVHLKVDTGMTRLGVLVEEAPAFFDAIKKMKNIRPVGLISHLADADKKLALKHQRLGFQKARLEFEKRFSSSEFHLANSLASMDRSFFGNEMVRLGVALYGAYPVSRQKRAVALRPVMHWKSRVVSVKTIPKGTPISYGGTYKTKKKTRIGVVPVGYADGYPRSASNRSFVLIGGKRVPVVGTVCMDMFMVNLEKVPAANVGDEVVLLGCQGKGMISGEELGEWGGTISYEIFCQVADRVPRYYLDSNGR